MNAQVLIKIIEFTEANKIVNDEEYYAYDGSYLILKDKELSPNFVPQHNAGHSWWEGAEEEYDTVFGISKDGNIEKLNIKAEYSYSDNGNPIHEKGQRLIDYLKETNSIDKYVMFLVHREGKEYGENGENYNYWELYKAPNFKLVVEKEKKEMLQKLAEYFGLGKPIFRK